MGITLVEILISVVLSSVLIIGVLTFTKSFVTGSKGSQTTSTMEIELSSFESTMLTDLQRSGNDPTLDALRAFRAKSGECDFDYFHYGLVRLPSTVNCETPIGEIGILSYQGIDVDRNRVFSPEEGLDFNYPTLRPPAPANVVPTPPNPLPRNFYNDYIVYSFDGLEISRKNLGNILTSQGDFTEVVLRNVIFFQVDFYDGPVPNITPPAAPGTYYGRIQVRVMVHSGTVEPTYINPRLPPDSPYLHYRTTERAFTYDVITSALSVL